MIETPRREVRLDGTPVIPDLRIGDHPPYRDTDLRMSAGRDITIRWAGFGWKGAGGEDGVGRTGRGGLTPLMNQYNVSKNTLFPGTAPRLCIRIKSVMK